MGIKPVSLPAAWKILTRPSEGIETYGFTPMICNVARKVYMYRLRKCGRGGIRTLDKLLTYTRFPGVPIQPLSHSSLHNIESSIVS